MASSSRLDRWVLLMEVSLSWWRVWTRARSLPGEETSRDHIQSGIHHISHMHPNNPIAQGHAPAAGHCQPGPHEN